MTYITKGETMGRHELGGGKGCGELGELGGLKAQRTEDEPRLGTFYLMGIENGEKEKHEECDVNNEAESVEDTVVHHKDDEAEAYRRANPHNLHAGARAEAEKVRVAVGIARAADADPPEGEEDEINGYCPPVKGLEDALAVTLFL